MIATNKTWERLSTVTSVEQRRPRQDAAELLNDAQDLDRSLELAQEGNSLTKIAGLRAQKWPQFFVLWQIIGGVSAYDAFLAMKYRDELFHEERNQLGRLLLSLNDGDPALFLGVKFMGTTMVLGILANLYHTRPQWGIVIATGVATFQLALLAYLTLR